MSQCSRRLTLPHGPLPFSAPCFYLTAQEVSRETKKFDNECYKSREDYFECLHGRKEQARIAAIVEEHKRQNKGGSIAKMIREMKSEA